MKIKKSRSRKKPILVITAIILILTLLGSIITYLYLGNSLFGWSPFGGSNSSDDNDSSINMSPATNEEIADGNNTKTQTVTETTKPGSENDTTNQQAATSSYTVEITTARQSGSLVQIRSIISPVTTSGACTLTFTNSAGQSVVKTSGVQAASSYSSCSGFDVPSSEFPAAGSWTAAINYKNGSDSNSASAQVEVTK